MKLSLKNQWIENLRSGKFEQGQGRLRDGDNKYCCLGVLCETIRQNGEVHNSHWGDAEESFVSAGVRYYAFYFDGERSVAPLSLKIREFTGLDVYQEGMLVRLNDFDDKSFSEIADWIEKNVLVTPEDPDIQEEGNPSAC